MGRTYDAFKKTEQTLKQHPAGVDLTSDPIIRPNGKRHKPPRIRWDLTPTVEEAYQKLRGNLFLGPDKVEIHSILMVSSIHGEGTTTTAALLASALAKVNTARLLLVDANFRTPALAEVFQLTDDTRGLTDLILGSATLHDVVRATPFRNLSVVTSGRPFRSPSHLFDAPSVSKVLSDLYERYDLIILDGPPVQDYADASFLSSMVDGTLLVVQAERTKIDTIREAKRQLERSGARVLGTVLNKKKRYVPAFLDRLL